MARSRRRWARAEECFRPSERVVREMYLCGDALDERLQLLAWSVQVELYGEKAWNAVRDGAIVLLVTESAASRIVARCSSCQILLEYLERWIERGQNARLAAKVVSTVDGIILGSRRMAHGAALFVVGVYGRGCGGSLLEVE